jgi:tetratricopeptide (TPR) repeat protein
MLENISFNSIKEKIQSDKKTKITTYIVGGALGLVIAFFLYRMFIWNPSNEKSKDAYWVGLNYAAKDSTDKAIQELEPVVKKYNGKVGGENAQFVLARQYMTKGQFQKALTLLEDVDAQDTYISVMTIGLQADCHSELKDYKKAGELYLDAAGAEDNELTTPVYLFKAGLCAEKDKDFQRATDCYQKIQDDYPNYASQKTIEKYIARASNKIAK